MKDDSETLAEHLRGRTEALRDRLRGPLFLLGDEGYAEEQAGFQTAFQNRPAMIVGATGASDVGAAVQYATAYGLPIAVQATGHGRPVTEGGGMLISTRRMTTLHVFPETRTVWLEAGVRWEQVIEAAAHHGLAPLNGSSPQVGAVSYTLGGGLSLLARQYGYAADHVRSIDVVTADGHLRHVTADTDPELFWALRGAGPNFGVVTGIEIGLVPVSRIYGGGMYFDADLVPDVLTAFEGWTRTVPEELTSSVSTLPIPDFPAFPEPIRGRFVAHVRIAYNGAAAEGERLVEPLRAAGPRLIDTVADMPYTECGAIYHDPPMPHAYYGGNVLLRGLDAAALRKVAERAGPDQPVMCVVDVRHLGGALARPPRVPNAVGNRDAEYVLRVLSPVDSMSVEDVRKIHEPVYDAVAPWTGGRCLNFVYGESATTDKVRTAYEPDDYQRLAELKAGYDPDNVFRLNYNIPPAPLRVG